MPFNREYQRDNGGYEYLPNRTRTGPPTPPPTGQVVEADGAVVVANQDKYPQIPPARPVKVTFPGPNEPLVGKDGRITPRWWRFLEELYRRTGGVVDNINRAPQTYLATGSPAALVLTGAAPSAEIDHYRLTGVVSLALTGAAPSAEIDHYRNVSKGSATLTGIAIADVLNAAP